MSTSEKESFLASYGPPREAVRLTEEELASASGRVPDDLIAFWSEHGVGSFATGLFWLCRPALFDPVLDALLLNVPDLRGKLTAIGYSATGDVTLWHREARLFSLLLPHGVFLDQTSVRESAPVPYDVDDLFASAGLQAPPEPAEWYRTLLQGPECIWRVLTSATSADTYRHEIGEDGRSLHAALRRLHGPLGRDEIYCRKTGDADFDNLAPSYERLPLAGVFRRLPPKVWVSRTVPAEPFPDAVTDEYEAGPFAPG